MTHPISLSRRNFMALGVGLTAALATPKLAFALNLAGGVAIQGYDPVAYFTQNAATKGDSSISAEHEGATYYFASTQNRDAFLAEPAKYAPKYGGYCAYAVSKGYTAPIDPQAFSVVDNRLYLNYSKSVRSLWSKDIPGNIKLGDANWPKLK